MDLLPKVPRGCLLIMDNCRIHHANNLIALWEMALSTYNIRPLFLPPYSPFINPIEYAFNDIKERVKSETFYNRGELSNIIDRHFNITPEKAKSFFNKASSYYPDLLTGLPFSGTIMNPLNNNTTPTPQNNNNNNNTLSNALATTRIESITEL